MNLLQLKAGRQQARRDFRASMQAQNQAIMGGVGDIVGAGIQGFAMGGGFTQDVGEEFLRDAQGNLTTNVNPDFIKGGFSFDTLFGRQSGNQNVIEQTKEYLKPKSESKTQP